MLEGYGDKKNPNKIQIKKKTTKNTQKTKQVQGTNSAGN